MKYILIALLFCTCGSSGEVEPNYFDSHFLGATYYPDKPDWQLSDGALDSGYHIERGLLYNFEVKDTLPAKPLNIKMKPRKQKDTTLTFGKYEDVPSINYDGANLFIFKVTPLQVYDTTGGWRAITDTVKVIMLCSDTTQNGFIPQKCFWMYGWEVVMGGKLGGEIHRGYLDADKRKLSKNLVVWLSKELK